MAVHSIMYQLLEKRAIRGIVMFGGTASLVVVTQLSGYRRRRTSMKRRGTT